MKTSPGWLQQPRKRKAYNLTILELFAPWLLVGTLFYVLRQLEVWLHQHIFKVGWLVTKQYQTTTVLYYAFFLPGIIINQAVFWLGAGLLNVSAERSISWPEKQEIGELKLDFIRLSKNVGPVRFAIISTIPLLVGMAAVWHIANNILNMPALWSAMNGGALGAGEALTQLTTAPDFWIWVYLAFSISNTMMPNFANLRGWRIILSVTGLLIVGLYALGAGDQIVMNNLRGPVSNALNSLSTIFAVVIAIDLFMVAALGTIEAIIERITEDSATFEQGKMITMRRSELLERRRQALAVRPQQRRAAAKATAVPSGPPSIYKLHLPIPGPPGKEATTPETTIVITSEPRPALPSTLQTTPAVISGSITEKLPPPSTPIGKPATPAAPLAPTPAKADAPATPRTPSFSSTSSAAPATAPASPFARPASPPPAVEARPATPAPKPLSPPKSVDDDEKNDNDYVDDESEDDATYEDFEDPA